MITIIEEITRELLEKYEFPEKRVDKEIWRMEDRKVIIDFLREKIEIVHTPDNNVIISFEGIEVLHKIINKEEIR